MDIHVSRVGTVIAVQPKTSNNIVMNIKKKTYILLEFTAVKLECEHLIYDCSLKYVYFSSVLLAILGIIKK